MICKKHMEFSICWWVVKFHMFFADHFWMLPLYREMKIIEFRSQHYNNTKYSRGENFVIFYFSLFFQKILDNFHNQGQFWNLLFLMISKHPLQVQYDQVLAEILSSSWPWPWPTWSLTFLTWSPTWPNLALADLVTNLTKPSLNLDKSGPGLTL